MTNGSPLTIDEAKALMKAGLGKAELDFVVSVTAPLYWVMRRDGKLRVRNGSAFFLNAGEGPFGVTAAHVVTGWREDCIAHEVVSTQLGHDLALDFGGRNALIDEHEGIDIATFRITDAEIRGLGKTILTGYQRVWPPGPPQRDKGVYYCGFPGKETLWMAPDAISFGIAAGSGIATSVSDLDVSSLIERNHLIDVVGNGLPKERFDFGGISGGPMLTVVEHRGLRSWQLAGVIYQGPNASEDPEEAIAGLDILKARRPHFIKPNGELNKALWNTFNPARGR